MFILYWLPNNMVECIYFIYNIFFTLGSSYNLTDKPAVKDIFRNVDLTKFVRYSGSLTTPGCYESVQWTLFTEMISISENQVN